MDTSVRKRDEGRVKEDHLPKRDTLKVLCLAADQFYHMVYQSWKSTSSTPKKNTKTVIAVHGLTRNSRDFDQLATYLCSTFTTTVPSYSYRVLCPDIVGRGESDWLQNKLLYKVPSYVQALATLIAAEAKGDKVDWVGTSMGGLIGMAIASLPNTPIRSLILNDVGPVVHAHGISRLIEYVGKEPEFDSLPDAEQYLRNKYKPFGQLKDDIWKHMTQTSVRPVTFQTSTETTSSTRYKMRYDPGIAENVVASSPTKDQSIWPVWENIHCPVMVLRGEHSDILTRETIQKMKEKRPKGADPLVVHEIKNVGHAPALMTSDQLQLVKKFLDQIHIV